MSSQEVEGVLKHFLVEKGAGEFGHSFGNVRGRYPQFEIHQEIPVWHEAAQNLGLSIEIKVVDDLRLKIKQVVSE